MWQYDKINLANEAVVDITCHIFIIPLSFIRCLGNLMPALHTVLQLNLGVMEDRDKINLDILCTITRGLFFTALLYIATVGYSTKTFKVADGRHDITPVESNVIKYNSTVINTTFVKVFMHFFETLSEKCYSTLAAHCQCHRIGGLSQPVASK